MVNCDDCPPAGQCDLCAEIEALDVRAATMDWNQLLLALANIRGGSDPESRHTEADRLLCIALMNAQPEEPNTQAVLDTVVRFYLQVEPKWYG